MWESLGQIISQECLILLLDARSTPGLRCLRLHCRLLRALARLPRSLRAILAMKKATAMEIFEIINVFMTRNQWQLSLFQKYVHAYMKVLTNNR